jgi:hypothetical protein
MTRYRKAVALLCALGIVAAACGGDDDDDAGSDTTTAATSAPEETTAPTDASAAPTTAGSAGTGDWGATLTDGEYGESYDPDPTLVDIGVAGPDGLPKE